MDSAPTTERKECASEQQRGTVVVGIDDSCPARQALRYAAEVARWRHWGLHIVHAFHANLPPSTYGVDMVAFEAALQTTAEGLVADLEDEVLGDEHGLDVRRTIVEGPPARILVAASEDADLLVVGNRGRGGLASLALGSVSQFCVHHAHCPVLVVRPDTVHESAA
jgi:nucleotide-binding universal stress UspA family protein